MRGVARFLVLIGGGGHAAVVAEAARACGWIVAGFLSDREASPLECERHQAIGLNRLGRPQDWKDQLAGAGTAVGRDARVVFHAAVGRADVRSRWLDMVGDDSLLEPVIHPSAILSPTARIAPGVFIGPLSIINARASIGRGTIINSASIIEHDCVIGECSHIAPGAALAGQVRIGDRTLIGLNATCLPGVTIGNGVTIGGGAVVIDDVHAGATAVGVPAHVLARA